MPVRVPLREGIFEDKGKDSTLLAVKCQVCQQVFFPAKAVCLSCFSHDLVQHKLSNIGRLYSFTIVHMPAKNYSAPYALGWIELSEGTRVFSQIRGWQDCPLKTGMEMKLSIEKLYEDDGREVIGYVFRPITEIRT
jgi:uncharacterized OB-fold protein